MPRTRKPRAPARSPRFFGRDVLGNFSVYERDRDGPGSKHFVTVSSLEGAERLADLLNQAAALGDDTHILSPNSDFGRQQIAHAVAKLFGMHVEKRED